MTEVIRYLMFLAFAGGGAWVMLKESVRHTNGLGAKLNRLEEERAKASEKQKLAIVALACGKPDAALKLLGE